MFKNALIYGLRCQEGLHALTADIFHHGLESQQYTTGSSQEMICMGWVPPVDGGQLAHLVGEHILMRLRVGKKVLPTKAVKREVEKERAKIEEQQGFKPGRKQTKEIHEAVTMRMLPAAFVVETDTWVWFDYKSGRFVIDTASPARADEILQLFSKATEGYPLSNIHVEISPATAMTEWIARDEAPEGFTIDQDTEFQSSGEGRAKVRYQYGSVEAEQARSHIEAGKHVTRLAMTWADRISFVLTESLALKRIAPLDVLKEGGSMAESFDGEFLLIAGEMSKLISDLIAALGGLKAD